MSEASAQTRRRTFRWLGAVVALAAGVFFVQQARSALSGNDLTALLRPGTLAAIGALGVLYALAVPSTALAWARILARLGTPMRFVTTVSILAASQFGKYLPGNVAQHVGRVVMARSKGLDVPGAVLSMVYETLLLLIACVHVSALTLLWNTPEALKGTALDTRRGEVLAAVSLGALAGMFLVPRVARIIAHRRGVAEQRASASSLDWRTALGCYALYLANFALVGAGLALVASTLAPGQASISDMVFLAGAYAGSWILGFLAPGAPAGLGIREAVLVVWLGSLYGPAHAVALAIALRIATTLGDLINFLWGSFSYARSPGVPGA